MLGTTRHEKTSQSVRKRKPEPAEARLRFANPCLELETDYKTNTIRACGGIHRPVERQLKIRPLAEVQRSDAAPRSIANRHQSYRWAGSEDLGNPIYYSRGHLRFCRLVVHVPRFGEKFTRVSGYPSDQAEIILASLGHVDRGVVKQTFEIAPPAAKAPNRRRPRTRRGRKVRARSEFAPGTREPSPLPIE